MKNVAKINYQDLSTGLKIAMIGGFLSMIFFTFFFLMGMVEGYFMV